MCEPTDRRTFIADGHEWLVSRQPSVAKSRGHCMKGTPRMRKSRRTPRTPPARPGAAPRNCLTSFMGSRAAIAALLAGAAALACGGSTQPPSTGAATKLSFTVQPSSATAGAGIAPAVAIQDASGNTVTSATGAVTVALGANPGGGTLSGTTTVNPVNGVASFSGLSINKAGAGYTLVASSIPLTSATSAAFTITPAAAAQLAFSGQPSGGTAGVALVPAVAVAIQDAFGNVVPGATNAVTVALGTNPAGGTLSGATTANAVNGVASFSGLAINKTGSGYTLVASSSPLASATSVAFAIASGPVASVWVNPGAAILTFPGGPTSIQLQATPLDAGGNPVATAVTWSTSDPNAATVDATGLVSAFGVGTATITATAGASAGTAIIGVACGPPRCSPIPSVGLTQQPATAPAGATISPVQVSIGNVGTAFTGVASIAIGNNPGDGTLTGNTDMQVSYYTPTATWSNLRIDKSGSGYTLVVIVKGTGGVGGATSVSFNITP